MADRVKEIPAKILEWWKKFSTKQKGLVVSVTAVVIVAMVILYVVLSKPTMVIIKECETTKQASEVKNIFDEGNIRYAVSDDGLVFKINKNDLANANILLGENKITAATYELNSVFEGGFSNTESDKNKKYQLYLEEKLASDLNVYEGVESATVNLNIPPDDGTIARGKQPTSASATLVLSGDMSQSVAEGLAMFIATSVGNKSTNEIVIMDSTGNVLFSGSEDNSVAGKMKKTQELNERQTENMKAQIREIVLGADMYQTADIGTNLKMNNDEVSIVEKDYSVPEGREEGPITRERDLNQETQGGVAAVPGTDNNDDTTYQLEDGGTSYSETTESERERAVNERVTSTVQELGKVDLDASSVTVVLGQHRTYKEDVLKSNGQLEGMTFDEFVEANQEKQDIEVPDDLVTMIANATGLPEDNISVKILEVPFFQYSTSSQRDIFDYIPIILAVLIMLMLGYVVFRSTRKEEVAQLEPELSVENLLETTKMAQQEELEDIGFAEKSETRLLIEKFVDDNPEAAAALLRNWLNEEWE